MQKITEDITTDIIEYINELHNSNNKLPAKSVSQIINNICAKYYNLPHEDRKIAQDIICKLSESYIFTEACIIKIAQNKIFQNCHDQLWLKNLCKNGYIIKYNLVSILGNAYYHIIVKGNDVEKIVYELNNCNHYDHDYKLLRILLEKEDIKFRIEDAIHWEKISPYCFSFSTYVNNFIEMFPMTIDYCRFLISCKLGNCINYTKYIKDKIISKFSDIFPNGIDMLYKNLPLQKTLDVFNGLINNGIWPSIEDLNKFDYLGDYSDMRKIVSYFLKNKSIHKMSECKILYGKIIFDPKNVQEIINLCIDNNIVLDANFINYIKYITPKNTLITQTTIHDKNIKILLTGENLDLPELINFSCANCDEILFNNLIEYAKENNIPEDSLFIDVNELLRSVMLNDKNVQHCQKILIIKKLLNMKAEPKKEYAEYIFNCESLKLFISYGLQLDDYIIETLTKKYIEIEFDEFMYCDPEKLYKYCNKYNFFPKYYKKYFCDKFNAHAQIDKLFVTIKRKRKTMDEDIIQVIEENNIIPEIWLYEKAVLYDCNQLVEYLEKKYDISPGYALINKMNDHRQIQLYIDKFSKYHKLTHLFDSKIISKIKV